MYMHLIPASEQLLCTIAANLDLGLGKKLWNIDGPLYNWKREVKK